MRVHVPRPALGAFLLAILLSIVVAGRETAATTPTVVLGTKNFSEEYILGQLYKQALEAKGYTVSYKESIGSTEIIDTALTSGKINFYPEYTGTILTAVFHKPKTPGSAVAVYQQAKQLQAKRGFTLFKMTPFYDRDEIGVLTSTAKQYKLKAVGDLKKVDNLVVCGFPEFAPRLQGAVGLKQVYGVTDFKFKPLASISAYQLLDQGDCTAADVFSTDAQLF